MLDQMFTAENFRRIFDLENRKGRDVAGMYFPDLDTHTQAVRDKVQQIREFRANESLTSPEIFSTTLLELKMQLYALKEAKSNAVDQEMEKISALVAASAFKIELNQILAPGEKPLYLIDKNAETFFVIKQLQRNLHKIYNVKQSNRHDLVCQIRDTIEGSFPFELVRTDISSFYESVDQRRLLGKLDRDRLLSPSSRKFIKQIINSYNNLSGTAFGIPRGVGVSAYLAELYLKDVDRDMRRLPGIILYCRYVDDVIAVFARPPMGNLGPSYEAQIIKIFADHFLVHNAGKTFSATLGQKNAIKFEYLGYRFSLKNNILELSPSASKVRKYKARLKKVFEDYEVTADFNAKKSFRNLVSRIKFLTGNARLLNSKSGAAVGVYFNNPIINDYSSLELLDKILKRRIAAIPRKALRNRLKPFRFISGFKERRFHNFSTQELQNIVAVWKHD